MRLTLALCVAAALSACATQPVEQSAAELRQSHGYVVAAVPLVMGADAPVITIRSTASGSEYTLSPLKPGADTRGLWVPKGAYEITSELGPRKGVSEPIEVEPGKVTDLGGFAWAPVGNRQRALLPIRHPDLSADIEQALAPLKTHVSPDRIRWQPSQVPAAQPVPVAMTNLGLIGALLTEYEAEVNKTPLRAQLRAARNLAEFTRIFLNSATPVLGEPGFDAGGQLYIGSNFGRLRVRDDQGSWRTIDTGAISPIMAVAVGADRWVVGTHDGQLIEGKSGAQVWTRVHQFADGESVLSLARAGSRYVVLTGHFAGTARQGFHASFDGLQVHLFDPAAQPQLKLLKKLVVSSSSPFTRLATLQAGAGGQHVFLNAGESVERLDMATLAWKTVSPSHDVSHLRVAGGAGVLTAFKAQGLFSKLSVSTDLGETWLMVETPPYPVHDIRMEGPTAGSASRWDTGAFSVALQTTAFDASSKSWRPTWTAPQSVCARTIRDAQGKEAWCVSGGGSILRIDNGKLVPEFLAD